METENILAQLANDKLVELLFHCKAERSDLAKADAELKEKQERITQELHNRCIAMGVDSFSAGGANIKRTIKRTIIVENGTNFLQWAMDNDRLDLVQIKHRSDPMKEYAATHEGELPSGMAYMEAYDLSVRKVKS